jgi:hypothetical protein
LSNNGSITPTAARSRQKGARAKCDGKLLSLAGSDYEREAIAAVRKAAAIRGYSAALATSKTPSGCGAAEVPNP